MVSKSPGGLHCRTPRPFARISETHFVQGLKGDSNAAAESPAHQQPDGSTKPGAWQHKPQKTPEALSCVALEARHLLWVGHLPRFDNITAVLKSSMKFCWLRRTKTVFTSRNSYYLSFTLDFLALAIIQIRAQCFVENELCIKGKAFQYDLKPFRRRALVGKVVSYVVFFDCGRWGVLAFRVFLFL